MEVLWHVKNPLPLFRTLASQMSCCELDESLSSDGSATEAGLTTTEKYQKNCARLLLDYCEAFGAKVEQHRELHQIAGNSKRGMPRPKIENPGVYSAGRLRPKTKVFERTEGPSHVLMDLAGLRVHEGQLNHDFHFRKNSQDSWL